jgi:hypothetical protein
MNCAICGKTLLPQHIPRHTCTVVQYNEHIEKLKRYIDRLQTRLYVTKSEVRYYNEENTKLRVLLHSNGIEIPETE